MCGFSGIGDRCAGLNACLTVSLRMHVCVCVGAGGRSECVSTLPETVSKSGVISEEFTVGCLPVVDAGGSY